MLTSTVGVGTRLVHAILCVVAYHKLTGDIASGMAAASVSGTYPDKRKFAGNASVTFHNDRAVTIDVRGMEFILKTESGDIVSPAN